MSGLGAAAALLREAELALQMARGCFEDWRTSPSEAPRATVVRHAYHVHEASRTVNLLIERFRADVAQHLVTPPPDVDIDVPPPRR